MTYDPGLGALEHTQPNGRRAGGDVDPTLAVVVARLDDLRESVAELRLELRSSTANVVSRGEWVQRNNLVDGKFDTQGREISQLRQDHASAIATVRGEHAQDIAKINAELASRRAPWWSVIAAIGSIVAVAAVLVPALAR